MSHKYQVIIIGAGATGSGLARDLALRGVDCLLIERGDVNAGASGRNHGLLHSGARYAVVDPRAAAECAREGAIIKRILPQCVDDCGGLFVAVPGDDPDYITKFPKHCAAAGITCREVDADEARALEPALAPDIAAAFAVPDASVDPFMLSLENVADAERHGGGFLRRHEVTGFERDGRRLTAALVTDLETGERKTLRADEFVIAAGGWSGRIAALAGCHVDMLLSKGTLLVTQTRLTRRVINRLRGPGDGDILVPGGSVSILGTTSVPVADPDDNTPTIAEVDANLAEALPLLPVLATTPFRRAYAGIRPLVRTGDGTPGADQEGRNVSRDFALVTHQAAGQGGVDNLLTLAGGKLTTYRLMAERAADALCERLGVRAVCRTATDIVPPSPLAEWSDPGLAHKYAWWQKHSPDDYLLCECEVVPQSAVDDLLRGLTAHRPPDGDGSADLLPALSARSRVGKGSCQGTFCGARITAHLYDCALTAGTEGAAGLKRFLRERWRGQRPVLWGDQLGQAELKEALYFGLMGLNDVELDDSPDARTTPGMNTGGPEDD